MAVPSKLATFETAAAGGTGTDGYDSKLETNGTVSVVTASTEGIGAPPSGKTKVAKHTVNSGASTRNARGSFTGLNIVQNDQVWFGFEMWIPAGFINQYGSNNSLLRLTGTSQDIFFQLGGSGKRLSPQHYDGTTTTNLGQIGSGQVPGGVYGLVEGAWNTFEMFCLFHATAGTAVTELWVNGQRKFRDTFRKNLTASGSSMTQVNFWHEVVSANSAAGTVYIDRAWIQGTQLVTVDRTAALSFEDNRIESGTDGSTTSGTTLVTASDKAYVGTYSAKGTITDVSAVFHRPWQDVYWDVGDTVVYSGAFYLETGWAPSHEAELLRWDTSLVTGSGGLWDVGGIQKTFQNNLICYFFPTGGAVETLVALGAVPRDRWFFIEVRQTLHNTNGSALTEVWIDGVSKGTSTNRNKGATGRQISSVRAFANIASGGTLTTSKSGWVDRFGVRKSSALFGTLDTPGASMFVKRNGVFVSITSGA